MFGAVGEFLGGLVKPITTVVEGWQARKAAKLASDLKINEAATEAKIERMRTQQAGDIAWENTSITNSGWKDEWFTVVLSIPVIMCFVPGLAVYVKAGFESLTASTPEWYQWAFLVAVSSSFGYKKLADFMALKKGV